MTDQTFLYITVIFLYFCSLRLVLIAINPLSYLSISDNLITHITIILYSPEAISQIVWKKFFTKIYLDDYVQYIQGSGYVIDLLLIAGMCTTISEGRGVGG